MKTLLSAAILAALFAMPASAQQAKFPCVKKEDLHVVTEKLGAEELFRGRHPTGVQYRIFINPTSGYWVAVNEGDKLSCILVEGQGFVITASKPK